MNTPTNPSVEDVLKQKTGRPGKGRAWKRWLSVVVVLAVAAGGWYYLQSPSASSEPRFQTQPATRGNLSVSVTATGNLQPLNQVDIGTELSGTVEAVLVDNNDQVKKGQVLARLNTTQLKDTITKGKASLASAQAKVKQAAAKSKEARTNLNRLLQLNQSSGGKLPAKSDLDSAQAAMDSALADEAVSKTTVISAEADLRSSETNLGKAIITSPIDGVVLNRSVETGQTVAASLSAPTLFTLAEDLSKMELEVGVDEADVGQVKEGQKAEFTVDAWPGRKYPASITRVSLGSTTADNVVSYATTLSVANADLTLRPGMTATATISTDSRENALLVPNAALRFKPTFGGNGGGRPSGDQSGGGFLSKLMPRPPGMNRQRTQPSKPDAAVGNSEQRVWILQDGHPRPVKVQTGITDGKMTEVVSGDLQPDMPVIIGSAAAGAGNSGPAGASR
ncbi:efflux RND transporter periplasmic adaptor subunit [Candidatus Thiothrix sp. Deng01]|uniref:Efflux RND transporter periplasmic adaptor subunit n=1 Tax=Candidatus Thiothrix phosphatis TaxID=3112415 RepID=A0ABU6CXM4_9GAMM|nr:efflux RND transporter periplasmic adaptor subunit [Candidatus Thiothrix sp. Deng01]MEB4591582.1 efflux RND transporter periplasmic adaptor subunit [Candidatus Thiothrix sp. Deng01]